MEPPIREEPPTPPQPPPPILDGTLHLLGELSDDVVIYRRREAAWISLIVHAVLVLLLIFVPKWIPSSSPVMVQPPDKEQYTSVVLPADQLKVPPPMTNKVSDQNRIAQTRTPQPDKETLRKLLDAQRPGPPKPSAAPQPQPQAQAQPEQQPQPPVPAQPKTTETAQLEAPPPKKNPFTISSASSSVDQAIQSAASNRTGMGNGTAPDSGNYGSGIRPRVSTRGDWEILSDTKGVDFGPYMKRLKVTVEDHWFPLVPEAALPPISKRGKLTIEFAIMKDGTILGMRLIAGSGDVALDRAAWGALTSAVPLPRLPIQFDGEYLLIRGTFYYNPDRHDLE